MAGAGRLILLRHGRTAWNATGRYQGRADPPLDGTGQAQSTRAATELRDCHPDAVVSSDLRRAAQTAHQVAHTCGLPIIFDPGLRELALGGWEGLTPPAAAAAFPEEYAAWTAGRDVRRGGGETEQEAGERAAAALRPVLQACHAGLTMIVVSHGLVLRGLLRELALPEVHLGNGEWISVGS